MEVEVEEETMVVEVGIKCGKSEVNMIKEMNKKGMDIRIEILKT